MVFIDGHTEIENNIVYYILGAIKLPHRHGRLIMVFKDSVSHRAEINKKNLSFRSLCTKSVSGTEMNPPLFLSVSTLTIFSHKNHLIIRASIHVEPF